MGLKLVQDDFKLKGSLLNTEKQNIKSEKCDIIGHDEKKRERLNLCIYSILDSLGVRL